LHGVRGATADALGCAVLDEKLNEDAPSDGPLLESVSRQPTLTLPSFTSSKMSPAKDNSRDNPSTDFLWRNLRLVDWNNGARYANAKPGNHASGAQHPDVLRCALDDGANDPKHARDLERDLPRVLVGDEGGCQRAHQGAGGHGRRYGALAVGYGITEVALVGLGAEDTAHGADVEAEEPTAWAD
jgi:hypothetical protein